MTDSGHIERALNDQGRLAALYEAELLDRPSVQSLDRFTRIASQALGTPVALVSLMDRDRNYISNEVGLVEPLKSTRVSDVPHSFCKHVVADRAPLIIEDARVHPTVKDNPSVTESQVIAYAGIPIWTRDDHVLGSFCVFDTRPRQWTDAQLTLLRELAGAVSEEIDLRRRTARAEHLLDVLTDRILSDRKAAADRTVSSMHLLQGPLGALMMDVDQLREHMSVEQHRELSTLLGNVRSNVEQATKLLGSIGATVTMPPAMTDAGECVRQVTDEMRGRREGTKLDVEVLQTGQVGLSAVQLWQCVEGLVDNAQRFAQSRVLVRVDARDGEVVVLVDDDGPGLPGAQSYRSIWEPRRGSLKREGKATGNHGLSAIRDAVMQAGGHVHARKSELGGARFALYLPTVG